MTETPDLHDNSVAGPNPSGRGVEQLPPASFLKLALSRPVLPARVSRVLGWTVFVALAVVPLMVIAGWVWYLRSSRWPTDFAQELSRSTGMSVSVSGLTFAGTEVRNLEGVRVYGSGSGEPILSALSGTCEAGECPRLFLQDVTISIDLDWWADPQAFPEPGQFAHPQTFPDVHLSKVEVDLRRGATTFGPVRGGTALLRSRGSVIEGRLVGDQGQPGSVSGSLGYRAGRLVKRLSLRGLRGPLPGQYLGRVIGDGLVAAFGEMSGDLDVGDLSGGNNWLLSGRTSVDASRLPHGLGLAGLTGTFELRFKEVGGLDGDLMQGEFEIRLAEGGGGVCTSEALRALQTLITGVEPPFVSGKQPIEFDRAGILITVTRERVYIQALDPNDIAVSSVDRPVLRFRPQSMPRMEFLRRLAVLRASRSDLHITLVQ